MHYIINEDYVNAIRDEEMEFSSRLVSAQAKTDYIRSELGNYIDSLEPDMASMLNNTLEDISIIFCRASEPAARISEMLNEIIDAYEEIIQNDRFSKD